ncbi:MAG: hypothetical protein ACUZ8O_04350 [Candidatus Anammoxibacter sp.]
MNHTDTAEAITMLYKEFDKDERRVQRETGISLQKGRNYIFIEEQVSNEVDTIKITPVELTLPCIESRTVKYQKR